MRIPILLSLLLISDFLGAVTALTDCKSTDRRIEGIFREEALVHKDELIRIVAESDEFAQVVFNLFKSDQISESFGLIEGRLEKLKNEPKHNHYGLFLAYFLRGKAYDKVHDQENAHASYEIAKSYLRKVESSKKMLNTLGRIQMANNWCLLHNSVARNLINLKHYEAAGFEILSVFEKLELLKMTSEEDFEQHFKLAVKLTKWLLKEYKSSNPSERDMEYMKSSINEIIHNLSV